MKNAIKATHEQRNSSQRDIDSNSTTSLIHPSWLNEELYACLNSPTEVNVQILDKHYNNQLLNIQIYAAR